MPEPDAPSGTDNSNDGDSRPQGGRSASPDAVERLKARAGRRSGRAGGSSKGGRSSRRRMSDEERKARWQKAVAKKARKIKLFADALILVCLLCVLGAHALPFAHKQFGFKDLEEARLILGAEALEFADVKVLRPDLVSVDFGAKRGYEVMRDLVKIDLARTAPDAKFISPGTKPLWVVEGGRTRGYQPAEPADVVSMLILIVPAGAVLLLLLYLLDFVAWMGRPLPIVSLLYGFGTVAYLMLTKVPETGSWNIIGTGGHGALAAWFMLLVPLFLLGTFSMLRFFFSARAKRYSFAGIEPPSASKAPTPPDMDKDQGEDERTDQGKDEGGEDAAVEGAAESPPSGPADEAPVEAPVEGLVEGLVEAPGVPDVPEVPAGPDAPATGDGLPDVTSDVSKTPVSSPAIKLNFDGPPDEDAADPDAKPDANADDDEGPPASPFD